MFAKVIVAATILGQLSCRASFALAETTEKRLNNGLAQCNAASAKYALATANSSVSLGLKDLGYQYVNIDHCWSSQSRNSTGYLVPDPTKWPNGIKAVTDQIHGMGLKFGLYGCAGTKTCAGYSGSQGYEVKDAQTLASCGTCSSPAGSTQTWYAKMRDALLSVNKPIFFSMCQWGRDNVWTWGADYGNSWRMSTDIWNNWASVVRIGSAAAGISQYAAPGGFNDLDMMGIIAINQDPLGKAATYFRPKGAPAPVSGQLYPYWAGPLSDGVVIGLVAANVSQTLSVSFSDVPGLGAGTFNWVEYYYTGRSGSGTSVSFSLGSHDMAVVKVTNPSATVPAPTAAPTSATAAHYGQCGGISWTGATACESPYTCQVSNDYYSQCL
ncbi:glycoside hydrolase superfamily [Diplogelasinospora grovesii]|uniref:Alpha-galactosidase n=1 Tax=Diplogelasinospora grovesii TaxID=303347 RepID=A0AAN6NH69_9PEZI|nr:glycoside hydrolase superfamily [Diplogelasinospora grovesii]